MKKVVAFEKSVFYRVPLRSGVVPMTIRSYDPGDSAGLARLFYDTVHRVNAADYSPEQLDARASGDVDLDEWNRSFLAPHTVAAEQDGVLIGFGDMDETGYLDHLYVHGDCQRQGVATTICDAREGPPLPQNSSPTPPSLPSPFLSIGGTGS